MRRRLSAVILFVLLGIAPRAHADDVVDQADLEFSLGAEAYQRADYRGALEHFLISNRLVANKNVLFNIARSYEQLRSYPEAFRYYSTASEGEGPGRASKDQPCLSDADQAIRHRTSHQHESGGRNPVASIGETSGRAASAHKCSGSRRDTTS